MSWKYVITTYALLCLVGTCFSATDCDDGPTYPNEDKVDQYYADIKNGDNSIKSGDSLKISLKRITKQTHKKLKYNCVWLVLHNLDEDDTNKDNIIELYSQNSVPKIDRDGLEHQTDRNLQWNREHVWAVSHGIGHDQTTRAYTDIHHIFAANKIKNAERGNLDFTEPGNQGWYPKIAIVRGQVARAMFYMELRYNGQPRSGNISTRDPNYDLVLVNRDTQTPESKFGYKDTLFKWHCESFPTKRERKRNEKAYEWQGNRNPYIDYPELVSMMYSDYKDVVRDNKCSNKNIFRCKDMTLGKGQRIPELICLVVFASAVVYNLI